MILCHAKTTDGKPLTAEEAKALQEHIEQHINHPPHYTRGKIEVWDFIMDQRLGFMSGNVIKYVCRAGHKGDALTDLRKAKAYLDKLIEQLEVAVTQTEGR